MSAHSQPSNDDMKRIPMACTRCRGMKLKVLCTLPSVLSTVLTSPSHQCRVPEGNTRCQRCINADKDCLFVPVSSEQPQTPTLSTPCMQGQFRLQPPIGSNGFQQHSPAQPITSAQHSWNAQPSALQPNYVAPGPDHSYTHGSNRYTGHFNQQQTQHGHQTVSGFPTTQVLQPNPPMHMNYPIQGMFHNGEMTSNPQNVADPGFDPRLVQYGQSTPNGATWSASTLYAVTPEDAQ